MKTIVRKKLEAGAVLLPVTICAFGILTTFAVSHLWLVMNEHRSMARAQAWNYALSVAEAGVEEGMAQLNAGGAGVGVNPNLAANNWTNNFSTYGYYGPKVSSLTNGGFSGSYSVTIVPGVHPVVTATATVRDPLNSQDIKRTVQLITTPFTPQTNHGIISITNAILTGNQNVISGNVASVFGTVTLRNADVIGTVETGGPTVTTKSNSIVSGGFNTNFYVDLPDVQPPFTAANSFPPPSDSQTKLYTSITFGASGNFYVNGSYNTKDKMPIIVTATNVALYVTGNITVPSLLIAPGASFKLYVGTTNTSSSSTTTLGDTSSTSINGSGQPGQFDYFGLPSNTTIDMKNGLTTMNGFIYAPEASLTQNGNMSIYGSLIAKSYDSNGGGRPNNFTLRDVSDSGQPPVLYYTVQSWREL